MDTTTVCEAFQVKRTHEVLQQCTAIKSGCPALGLRALLHPHPKIWAEILISCGAGCLTIFSI